MSDFLAWLYPGDSVAIGGAVVLLQITVVVAMAAVAVRLLRRRAALRHAVWLCAFGCVIASPLLAVFAGRLGIGLVRLEPPYSQAIVDEEPSALGWNQCTAPVSVPASSENRETATPLVAPETAPLTPTNVSKVANIPNFAAPLDLRAPFAAPYISLGLSGPSSCCCDCYMGFMASPVFAGGRAAQPATNDGRVRRRPSCAWRRGIAADSDLASARDRPRPAYFFRAFCCRKGWSMRSTTGNSATC